MSCVQCGAHNPESAAFCGICGGRLEKEAGQPLVNAINQSITPKPEAPVGSGQSFAEYIPVVEEMPMASLTSNTPQPAQPFYVPDPLQAEQASAAIGTYPAAFLQQATQPHLAPTGSPEPPTVTPPVVRVPWYKKLSRPMPLWAFLGSIAVVVLVFVLLLLTGRDWAAGAMRMGMVAGILAGVVLLAVIVRTLLGMASRANSRRVGQFVSAGLSFLLLLVLCLIGLTQQSPLHRLQAHFLEGQQQWQTAINEYQLAGEGAPTSENIARVYNEWGEQLSATQHFQEAFTRFNIVTNNYGSATTGVALAQSDTIRAYLGWGQQASRQQDYAAATSHYDALLQLSYCTASCQSQANALDATAYYNLAESQLANQNYSSAVTSFQTLTSRFASSPEGHQVHADYAKALLGQGKQQLATVCLSAIPTYQQLSSQFGDTLEGQQATKALQAPQGVKGRFTGIIPTDPSLTIEAALMRGLYNNIPSGQFFQLLSGAPTATIQRDGSFSFKPLKQGSYDLVWGTNRSNGSRYFVTYFNKNDNSPSYVATIGPLCTYDFGNIKQDIPVAP